MFSRRVWMFSLMLSSLAALVAAPGEALASGPRQYYSSWQKHPTATYHYRSYYYKPTPTYSGYKHHYVVYYPQRPKHVYYYNPYKKQFWGRCPVGTNGQGQYSLLAEKDRRGSLKEIPEAAFPKPARVPPVPESTDSAPLDLPPDDLPDGETPGLTVPSPPSE